jgi:aspartate aminotransferase
MQQMIPRCTHLRPDLAVYTKNRQTLMDALLEYGYEMAKPEGAFYLFVKAPCGDDQVFYKKALEKDLLFVPGSAFGCTGYFRLCYCVSYDTIERSLPLFKQLIEEA